MKFFINKLPQFIVLILYKLYFGLIIELMVFTLWSSRAWSYVNRLDMTLVPAVNEDLTFTKLAGYEPNATSMYSSPEEGSCVPVVGLTSVLLRKYRICEPVR